MYNLGRIREPLVIRTIRIFLEVVWGFLKVFFYTIFSVYRLFVAPSSKDVQCEIVLITGAGHGIGREVALRFGRLGAHVVCIDINSETNNKTVEMINEDNGLAVGYRCDVTRRGAVFELFRDVTDEVGNVTILINNAGVMPCKPISKYSEAEVIHMMDVNVNANIWMIQAFLPSMIETNHGHIVAMSSMAGLLGLRNLVPYCGSKHAVRGIMTALAVELQDDRRATNGIKLTTIYPHMVDTGLCRRPRIRFPSLLSLVSVEEAADKIVDAIRKEYLEITIPYFLHYFVRYCVNLIPFRAAKVLDDFLNTGVNAHDTDD